MALNDVKGVELIEQFSRDDLVAHGLPAFAYNNEDYWRREKDKLFGNNWIFVGFVHELTEPGDIIPVTIGGKPIFLICNQEKKIRAFHNVCRHRCLKLVDKPGNVGPRIRCPYHSWVYALNGDLLSTPYFGGPDQHSPEGFDKTQHGLVPVNCTAWHDWIFINLSKDPVNFEQYIAPLKSRLSSIKLDHAVPVATLEFGEVKANWKLLMENFIEPYHVQFVHSTTTDQPLKNHYTVIDCHCLGSAVDISEPTDKGSSTLAVSSLYLTLFPNFVFGHYHPDQIGVHLNTPLDVARTLQKRVIYIIDDNPRDDQRVEQLKQLWHNVHKEDHAICERLQEGKSSDVAASGGVLSPIWENSVRRFQELSLNAIQLDQLKQKQPIRRGPP